MPRGRVRRGGEIVMGFDSWLAERLERTNANRASAERGIFEACCPFCKTAERSFWFSMTSMRGGCLRKSRCGWRGDAVKLVMELDGVPFAAAIRTVRELGGPSMVRRRAADEREQDGACKLPDEYRPLFKPDTIACWAAPSRYLFNRQVSTEQQRRHRIGYCVTGRYNDRIVVPVVERGDVVYFVARLFRGKGKSYRYPTVEEAAGRTQADVLFNLDGVQGRPRVRVVEGVFDCLAEERRGEASVAMLGLAVSETQAAKLALAGCQEAVVEADGDAPWREVEKVARRLEGVMRVSVARPERDRDPDELSASPRPVKWGLSARVKAMLGRRGEDAYLD